MFGVDNCFASGHKYVGNFRTRIFFRLFWNFPEALIFLTIKGSFVKNESVVGDTFLCPIPMAYRNCFYYRVEGVHCFTFFMRPALRLLSSSCSTTSSSRCSLHSTLSCFTFFSHYSTSAVNWILCRHLLHDISLQAIRIQNYRPDPPPGDEIVCIPDDPTPERAAVRHRLTPTFSSIPPADGIKTNNPVANSGGAARLRSRDFEMW